MSLISRLAKLERRAGQSDGGIAVALVGGLSQEEKDKRIAEAGERAGEDGFVFIIDLAESEEG